MTVLQAAERGWLVVVRNKLEKAVQDDDSVRTARTLPACGATWLDLSV